MDTGHVIEQKWHTFIQKEQLNQLQTEQFRQYYELLSTWNAKINITRIIDLEDVLSYHFQDSLFIDRFIDCTQLRSICDVGSGGGFPGIPLKIKYPHLRVLLIEVNSKKIQFLDEVIQKLGLDDIEVVPLDWRTFLRTTQAPIDYFCARASLAPEELVRMFKPDSFYNQAQLIYWASAQWVMQPVEADYFTKEVAYTVGNKKRRFVFFAHK